MDGFINAKIEKQTIYEIYRACRLCGAGAGYKMPIIQNVVDLDGAEVELKQKIRECVQIEVHQDDKMPPLICELCVDKVNDFYEFLEMCRQTNKRTRLRLGLPPQAMPRGAPDAGDCILGVTEPVFINDGSNEHSLRSKNKSNKSGKNKKEVKKVIISHNSSKKDSRDSRNEPRSLRSKQPSPPRLRGTKRFHEEDVSLNKVEKAKKPASILKKEVKIEDNSFLAPRLKRPREREMPVKKEVPNNKKVKIVVKPLPARTTRTSPHIKSKSPPPSHRCKICKAAFDNYRSLNNHMRSHLRAKQVDRKPVKKESKDVKCTDCGKSFPKRTLLNIHTCPKQGGNCKICNRHFYSQKSLIRHRSTCVEKKKDVYINPKIRRVLRPLQIRVARCDPILKNVLGKYYDVSGIEHDFGLDKNCHYPYASLGSLRIKFEPGYMVDINDDIRQAFDADKYVHWDSDDTDSDLELTNSSKKVDSLTSLSLKTIFSQKFLGKVPKKRRKVKAEKAFDSILNVSEFDTELKRGIDNIIESLDDDKIDSDKGKADKSGDNDSLFGDENAPAITNNDFDSLFDNNKSLSTVNDKEINDNVNNDNDKNITENSINESTVSKELSSKDLSETELSRELDETLCMTTDNESIEKENVSSGLDENVENTEVKTNITNVNENIDSNENTNVNDKDEVNTVNTEVKDSLDQNVENKSEEIKQVTESSKNDSILSETTQINNESSITNNTLDDRGNVSKDNTINTTENTSNDNTQTENGAKTDKSAIKTVNGESELEQKFNMDDLEDLSESEMDDKKLMAALDAQIGENETGDAKNACESDKKLKENMDAMVPSVKSADLESISDEEFNLNE